MRSLALHWHQLNFIAKLALGLHKPFVVAVSNSTYIYKVNHDPIVATVSDNWCNSWWVVVCSRLGTNSTTVKHPCNVFLRDSIVQLIDPLMGFCNTYFKLVYKLY